MDCLHRIKPDDFVNLSKEQETNFIDKKIKYLIYDFKSIILKINDDVFKKNIESILSSYRKKKIEYSQYFIDSVINSYDNSFYIYLFNENKIIGMSRAGVRKDKVELSMVYILHDYRKQGYSYNMLKKFIHFLEKEKEFIKIGLSVEKENIAAFKLYKKLNFIIESEKTEELYENNKLVKYDFIYMYHKLL